MLISHDDYQRINCLTKDIFCQKILVLRVASDS